MATKKKSRKVEDLDLELRAKLWNELGGQSELVPVTTQHVSGSESRDFAFRQEVVGFDSKTGETLYVDTRTPLDDAREEYGWAKDNIPAMLWCILGELVYARRHG